MTLININPQDRRWIARWLRSNLVCVFVAGCLLLVLRVESTVPVIRMKQANADSVVRSEEGISVPPQGWRRTANGWEHVSGWQQLASRPLGELVLNQRRREPVWIQTALRTLRQLPPLTFALLQLTAIAAIVWVAEARKKRDQKSPIAS
jgi:hypothetical protein